jgi:inner membrane protein import complex subunit Tim44-like protein
MSIRRPSWRVILAVFWCVSLMLAPALAEARAGAAFGSHPSSVGSRGWRSYENNAQPSWSQPSGGLGARAPGLGGSLFQRHPFLTGLAGGILGSWLFGHVGFGLLRLLLLGLAIWFVVRLVRRMLSSAGPPGGAAMPMPRSAGAAAVPMPPDRGRDINLPDANLYQFQQIHAQVQDAWSAADLARLRPLMTPEMLRWFSEELSRNASRGVQNIISGVKLLKGELIESWDEGDRQYATALLRWRAVDYVVELGRAPGQGEFVADGDPRTPVEVEETWTFVRRRGGTWLLSAIQQV